MSFRVWYILSVREALLQGGAYCSGITAPCRSDKAKMRRHHPTNPIPVSVSIRPGAGAPRRSGQSGCSPGPHPPIVREPAEYIDADILRSITGKLQMVDGFPEFFVVDLPSGFPLSDQIGGFESETDRSEPGSIQKRAQLRRDFTQMKAVLDSGIEPAIVSG